MSAAAKEARTAAAGLPAMVAWTAAAVWKKEAADAVVAVVGGAEVAGVAAEVVVEAEEVEAAAEVGAEVAEEVVGDGNFSRRLYDKFL